MLRRTSGVMSAVAYSLLASACATIASGPRQTIEIRSSPPGATITAEPSGASTTTPGRLELARKEAVYRITFDKPGYRREESLVRAGTNPWFYLNYYWLLAIIPGILFMVVDSSTGAQYALEPDRIDVTLVPETGQASTPREP